MATPTLDDILDLPTTQEALDNYVLPELRAARDGVVLPVNDWSVGDPLRALSYGAASLVANQTRPMIAAFAAAQFGDYVGGLASTPNDLDVTGWVTAWAANRGVTRIDATYTKRTIRLTNSVAAAYGPITAGAIVIRFTATGNRYVLAEDEDQDGAAPITIPSSADPTPYVDAVFRSEQTVDSTADPARTYLDSSSATIQIVTGVYPGVVATNPADTFSETTQSGTGTGTVTLSGTPGVGWTSSSWQVRIDTQGQTGVATWSYRYVQNSTSGLSAWVSAGAVAAVANAAGSGITITLANGGGTPSFAAGDLYASSTPGTDVVQAGRDQETPAELVARTRALYPSLAFPLDGSGNVILSAPTMDAYEALARSASTQVKICLVRTSTTVNNTVHIIVAGQGVQLAASVISTLQAFFDAYNMISDRVIVASPSTVAINLAGMTVTVKKAQLEAAQESIQTKIANYLGGVDQSRTLSIGDGSTVYVRRDWLIKLITETAGVTDCTDDTFTIEGAAADYLLAADTMATWSEEVATVFSWTTT